MNFFDNEYALPVIYGGCNESISAAHFLRKRTKTRVSIFADKLSLINKIRFNHQHLSCKYDDISILSLIEYSKQLNEFYSPILVYCDEHDGAFIMKHLNKLEAYYILIPTNEIKKHFTKGDIEQNENK